jgi:thiol:disulfide interchange protein
MMKTKQRCLTLYMVIAASLATAQLSVAQHVAKSVVNSRTHVQPGETFQVAVLLKIDKGWHVYSPLETKEMGIAMALAPEVHADVLFGAIQYPAGEKHTYEFSGDSWEYRNQVVIPVFCKLNQAFAGEEVKLRFLLTYQECNDSVCLPTVEFVPIELAVAVKKGESGKPAREELFGRETGNGSWMIVSQDGARPGDKIKVLSPTTEKKSAAGSITVGDGTEDAGSVEQLSALAATRLVTVGTNVRTKYWTIERRHKAADGSVQVAAVALPMQDASATVKKINVAAFGDNQKEEPTKANEGFP